MWLRKPCDFVVCSFILMKLLSGNLSSSWLVKYTEQLAVLLYSFTFLSGGDSLLKP